MAASENGIEVIPANKYGMLLGINHRPKDNDMPYSMPPSYTVKIYPCVEIEWPFLVELEDDYPGKYTLEMRKTPVVRIYCRHHAKYNDYKVKPTHTERGLGTEESPYVAIGTAIEHAICLIKRTCVHVQVYIMPDSEEVFILNYGSSTFDSADNRLLIGSTDGETYFNLSDISESPNGQHIADTIVCQCRYIGDKAPCSNGNLDYYKAELVGTKRPTGLNDGYEVLECEELINCNIKNISITGEIVYGCDIYYDVFKYTYTNHNNPEDRVTGGRVYVSGLNNSKITNVSSMSSNHTHIHNSEVTGVFEEIRTIYGPSYTPVTIKRIDCSFKSSIISESSIQNIKVECNILINSKIVSIGSTDTFAELAFVKDVCTGNNITFSTSAFIYYFNGSTTDIAVALNIGDKCVISNTKSTCSFSSTGSGGSGWLVSCDIARELKCLQGCKTISYGNPNGRPLWICD